MNTTSKEFEEIELHGPSPAYSQLPPPPQPPPPLPTRNPSRRQNNNNSGHNHCSSHRRTGTSNTHNSSSGGGGGGGGYNNRPASGWAPVDHGRRRGTLLGLPHRWCPFAGRPAALRWAALLGFTVLVIGVLVIGVLVTGLVFTGIYAVVNARQGEGTKGEVVEGAEKDMEGTADAAGRDGGEGKEGEGGWVGLEGLSREGGTPREVGRDIYFEPVDGFDDEDDDDVQGGGGGFDPPSFTLPSLIMTPTATITIPDNGIWGPAGPITTPPITKPPDETATRGVGATETHNAAPRDYGYGSSTTTSSSPSVLAEIMLGVAVVVAWVMYCRSEGDCLTLKS